MVASVWVLSEGCGHGGPGVCLGDGSGGGRRITVARWTWRCVAPTYGPLPHLTWFTGIGVICDAVISSNVDTWKVGQLFVLLAGALLVKIKLSVRKNCEFLLFWWSSISRIARIMWWRTYRSKVAYIFCYTIENKKSGTKTFFFQIWYRNRQTICVGKMQPIFLKTLMPLITVWCVTYLFFSFSYFFTI